MSALRRQLSLPYGIISRIAGKRSGRPRGPRPPEVGRQLDAVTGRDAHVPDRLDLVTRFAGGAAGGSPGMAVAESAAGRFGRGWHVAESTASHARPDAPPGPCDDAAMDDDRPIANGPWIRRSRRVGYENPWITIWHDEVTRPDGRPGIYGVVHFANLAAGVLVLDEPIASCSSASIATRSTTTRGRSRRAACPPARRRSRAPAANCSKRPGLGLRLAGTGPRPPLEQRLGRTGDPLPRDRPVARAGGTGRHRGPRDPLAAVRRGPRDDARRAHHRRDDASSRSSAWPCLRARSEVTGQ